MTVFRASQCLGTVLLLVLGSACTQAPDSRTETSSQTLFNRQPDFGDPLQGLSASDLARFEAGQDEFTDVETVADGLGPVFNEASCAACHVGPNGAIGGTNQRLETRFGFRNSFTGKFGWKAQVPSLFVFSGDAYLNEMGITNPIFPKENCPQGNCALLAANPVPTLNDDGTGVEAFNDFMTLLAPPPRGSQSFQTDRGNDVARAIGCLDCHVQTLQTGRNAVRALDQVFYHPFSDFLLHDMGQLGDGITQNQATGRLMRTQPLWGLRTQTLMLHDGSATTITDAILAHDGQARDSRRRFERLGTFDRGALLAFLKSL